MLLCTVCRLLICLFFPRYVNFASRVFFLFIQVLFFVFIVFSSVYIYSIRGFDKTLAFLNGKFGCLLVVIEHGVAQLRTVRRVRRSKKKEKKTVHVRITRERGTRTNIVRRVSTLKTAQPCTQTPRRYTPVPYVHIAFRINATAD